MKGSDFPISSRELAECLISHQPGRRRSNKGIDITATEILEKLFEGKTTKEIAEESNCTETLVELVCIYYGIELNDKGMIEMEKEKTKIQIVREKLPKALLEKELESGLRPIDIARKYQIPQVYISYLKKEYGMSKKEKVNTETDVLPPANFQIKGKVQQQIGTTLGDLNKYLFIQLERLTNENLHGEQLLEEINRSKAIALISLQILTSKNVSLESKKALKELKNIENPMRST